MQKKVKNTEARTIFEILVRENQAMLMTYLRAIVRNQSVIEDLFQETMLTAWQKLDEYDRTLPFGPWLRGIASKLVMAHFRKAKSDIILFESGTLEYLDQQLEYISQKPGDRWDEKISALMHCIETLPDNYREAIYLRYFEENSTLRTSEILKTNIETVKKRLQRARVQLLECLKRKKVVMEIET
jgi:RNA polymerase sigma factor (sigma-70 family)